MRYLTGLDGVRGGHLDGRILRRCRLLLIVVVVVRRGWIAPGLGRMWRFGLGHARRRRGLDCWVGCVRIGWIII